MKTCFIVISAVVTGMFLSGCGSREQSPESAEMFDVKPFFNKKKAEVVKMLGEPSADFGYDLIWEAEKAPSPLRRLILVFRAANGAESCWHVHGTIETGEDLERVPDLLGLAGLERECTRTPFRANVPGAVKSVKLECKVSPYTVSIIEADAPGVSKRYKNFHVKLR